MFVVSSGESFLWGEALDDVICLVHCVMSVSGLVSKANRVYSVWEPAPVVSYYSICVDNELRGHLVLFLLLQTREIQLLDEYIEVCSQRFLLIRIWNEVRVLETNSFQRQASFTYLQNKVFDKEYHYPLMINEQNNPQNSAESEVAGQEWVDWRKYRICSLVVFFSN